jgi:hypothetical protein
MLTKQTTSQKRITFFTNAKKPTEQTTKENLVPQDKQAIEGRSETQLLEEEKVEDTFINLAPVQDLNEREGNDLQESITLDMVDKQLKSFTKIGIKEAAFMCPNCQATTKLENRGGTGKCNQFGIRIPSLRCTACGSTTRTEKYIRKDDLERRKTYETIIQNMTQLQILGTPRKRSKKISEESVREPLQDVTFTTQTTNVDDNIQNKANGEAEKSDDTENATVEDYDATPEVEDPTIPVHTFKQMQDLMIKMATDIDKLTNKVYFLEQENKDLRQIVNNIQIQQLKTTMETHSVKSTVKEIQANVQQASSNCDKQRRNNGCHANVDQTRDSEPAKEQSSSSQITTMKTDQKSYKQVLESNKAQANNKLTSMDKKRLIRSGQAVPPPSQFCKIHLKVSLRKEINILTAKGYKNARSKCIHNFLEATQLRPFVTMYSAIGNGILQLYIPKAVEDKVKDKIAELSLQTTMFSTNVVPSYASDYNRDTLTTRLAFLYHRAKFQALKECILEDLTANQIKQVKEVAANYRSMESPTYDL